jgi:hypothetical protein
MVDTQAQQMQEQSHRCIFSFVGLKPKENKRWRLSEPLIKAFRHVRSTCIKPSNA